jgi:hypothetical protein
MRHSNLDAIVASHQDTILCPAQMCDADREPYANGKEGKGERESRHIGQHALPVIAIVFAVALIAGQVLGYIKLVDHLGAAPLGDHRSAGPRPKLEHTVLLIWRG